MLFPPANVLSIEFYWYFTQPTLKCSKCKSRWIFTVIMHISNQHEKKPCSYCGEMFGENRMARHILSKHSSNADRPYKCNFCAKGFISKNRLKEHTNIHTGERPFMCKYCGASFANNGNCRMHERMMHLGHKRWIRKISAKHRQKSDTTQRRWR